MLQPSNDSGLGGPRVAAGAILCVFLVYLVVLAIGGPITSLGSKEWSFAYAVLVFIPVALICAYTIVRRSR